MAYTLQYEHAGAGVVVTLSGVATAADIFAASGHIYHPARLPNLRYQIYDLSAVHAVEMSLDHLQEFAVRDAEAARRNPHFVLAIVIDPALEPSLQRIYTIYEAAYANCLQNRMFPTLAAARHWVATQHPAAAPPTASPPPD